MFHGKSLNFRVDLGPVMCILRENRDSNMGLQRLRMSCAGCVWSTNGELTLSLIGQNQECLSVRRNSQRGVEALLLYSDIRPRGQPAPLRCIDFVQDAYHFTRHRHLSRRSSSDLPRLVPSAASQVSTSSPRASRFANYRESQRYTTRSCVDHVPVVEQAIW